ncbi:MAG: hypothetical protein OXU75_06445 [Deltaproteobacteria bacterium]|nr:hypothetical protein [Deltaproteobacteria bacterium]
MSIPAGRSPEDVLSGLSFGERDPAEGAQIEPTDNPISGFTVFNVTDAWREVVRQYGQPQDVQRLTRGLSLQIGGKVTPTISLETLLGIGGGASGMPIPTAFTQTATAARTQLNQRRCWQEISGPLAWPEDTTHVRLARIVARIPSPSTTLADRAGISVWAYTVRSGAALDQWFAPTTTGSRSVSAEYRSDGTDVAAIRTAAVGGLWRPIGQYPNDWVVGCALEDTNEIFPATGVPMRLEFETLQA